MEKQKSVERMQAKNCTASLPPPCSFMPFMNGGTAWVEHGKVDEKHSD